MVVGVIHRVKMCYPSQINILSRSPVRIVKVANNIKIIADGSISQAP